MLIRGNNKASSYREPVRSEHQKYAQGHLSLKESVGVVDPMRLCKRPDKPAWRFSPTPGGYTGILRFSVLSHHWPLPMLIGSPLVAARIFASVSGLNGRVSRENEAQNAPSFVTPTEEDAANCSGTRGVTSPISPSRHS